MRAAIIGGVRTVCRLLCVLAVLMHVATPVFAYAPAAAAPDFSALCQASRPATADHQGKRHHGIGPSTASHCAACSAALSAAPAAAAVLPAVLPPARFAPVAAVVTTVRALAVAHAPARAPPNAA